MLAWILNLGFAASGLVSVVTDAEFYDFSEDETMFFLSNDVNLYDFR